MTELDILKEFDGPAIADDADATATIADEADADAAWQADMRDGVKQLRDLDRLPLSQAERAAAAEANRLHKIRIPKSYLDLINWDDPNDPIRRQVIPSPNELLFADGESNDPIGDIVFSPVSRLTHRHADRVLLFPTYFCAVNCRFCFRKEVLAAEGRGYRKSALRDAYAYLESHPEIREVILTGGDSLSLPDDALEEIRTRIEQIPHIILLRIHTRVPLVLPSRITHGLVQALRGRMMVTVVTHFNHPREITPEVEVACRRLREAGFMLLNQSVLLKGLNDNVDTLEQLFRELVCRLGVKPYYLHHGDLVRGMSHQRTTIDAGLELMRKLRSRVTGVCLPTYVLDLPDGGGKVPLGTDYVVSREGPVWQFRGYDGKVRRYTEIAAPSDGA
jgi:lysine 2,3-aminomutase